jgi:uncharacterized membrane protein YeiH
MVFYSLDIIGTFAFAISGTLTAFNKKMDPFGVFIVAFVTAVGGGTLRDVMIGNAPVGWMQDLNYGAVILAAAILAVLFRRYIKYVRKSLFLFDTIGLGVFTLIGIEAGLQVNLHPIICIALGTITASFGGVIRDILCNEITVLFREEIYATACIIGGIVFFILREVQIPADIIYISVASVVITVRLLAVRFKLQLPSFYKN